METYCPFLVSGVAERLGYLVLKGLDLRPRVQPYCCQSLDRAHGLASFSNAVTRCQFSCPSACNRVAWLFRHRRRDKILHDIALQNRPVLPTRNNEALVHFQLQANVVIWAMPFAKQGGQAVAFALVGLVAAQLQVGPRLMQCLQPLLGQQLFAGTLRVVQKADICLAHYAV